MNAGYKDSLREPSLFPSLPASLLDEFKFLFAHKRILLAAVPESGRFQTRITLLGAGIIQLWSSLYPRSPRSYAGGVYLIRGVNRKPSAVHSTG